MTIVMLLVSLPVAWTYPINRTTHRRLLSKLDLAARESQDA